MQRERDSYSQICKGLMCCLCFLLITVTSPKSTSTIVSLLLSNMMLSGWRVRVKRAGGEGEWAGTWEGRGARGREYGMERVSARYWYAVRSEL